MGGIDLNLLRAGVAYADQWVEYQQDRRELPGVALAIWHDDGLLLSRGYGYADLEQQTPMTPRRIFRVASHSKTFTATAVMQLMEGGKLRLDDRLAQYIPWLEQQDGLARVTIRQALSHSAGLVRDGNDADYWQLDAAFPDGDELRRLAEDGGAVLAANEAFKYSNIGYGLLGLVIEAASGMPYHQYVTRHIVDRLGLLDTGPETDAHARERLVTGYTARRLGLPRRPIRDVATGALAPATGFYSTAEDLCRYAAAHFFGDDTLLGDAAKREMQQPSWRIDGSDERYGLGVSILELGERRMVGHGGAFPGHATRTMFDPRDRLAVTVLTNEIGGPAAVFARTVVRIIDFALGQPQVQAQVQAQTQTQTVQGEASGPYDRFTGRFVNLWGVTDVAAFGDALVALNPDAEDPLSPLTRLAVEDDDTLRITAASGYGAPGETMRYLRDDQGRATRIIAGGVSLYPLDIFRQRQAQG